MGFVGTLYPFQADAVEMMTGRENLLLAIVMGGGKTPTTIAAIEELVQRGRVATGLVIVPASLKYQWQRQIYNFSGQRACVVDGTPKTRWFLYDHARNFRYVVMNYEQVVNDWEKVRMMRPDFIVLDEATYIKGFRSKRSRAIKALAKRVPVRFALTGQPIENKPEELFSIMEFVDPDVLGNPQVFDRTFIERDYWGRPVRYRNLKLLRGRLGDAMFRRNRADIADQLPEVITSVVPVTLDKKGAALYEAIANDLIDSITNAIGQFGNGFNLWSHYGRNEDGAAMKAQGEIMSRVLALRMLCDSPELVRWSAELFLDEGTVSGSQYAAALQEAGVLADVKAEPKLDDLVEYIGELLLEDDNNKVVVFSFFKQMLRYLRDDITDKLGGPHLAEPVLFMGDMNARQREASLLAFKNDPRCRVFLSSDAGGYGVDLPEANHLISVDLPWSAGKFDQRQSRIIRLSSAWPHVNVTSFIIRGSVEERIYQMLEEKQGIGDAFIDGKHDEKGRYEVSLSSLLSFLRESSVR